MNPLFQIIHEDESLLIVNKPAGLVCHPTKGDAHSSLISRLRLYLGPDAPVHLVNRLDRETSGLIVVAKSDAAAAAARARWERGEVVKIYLAIVEGWMTDAAGIVDAAIGPDESSPVAIKSRVREDGAPSRTGFNVIYRFRRAEAMYSVLLVVPKTGRKHQIRVHLAHIGHPIVGDKIYGPDAGIYLAFVAGQMTEEQRGRMGLPNQALHAWKLLWDEDGGSRSYTAEPEALFLDFAGMSESQLAACGERIWVDCRVSGGMGRYSDATFPDSFKDFPKKS